MSAVVDERLTDIEIEWSDEACVCVVMASGGYPKSYQKGYKIDGIKQAESLGATVFHAGTKLDGTDVLTNGGRVLGVTAMGETLDEAIKKAYGYVDVIHFKDAHFRHDIGIK